MPRAVYLPAHQLLAKVLESSQWSALSANVSKLLSCGDFLQHNLSSDTRFAKPMRLDGIVFGSRSELRRLFLRKNQSSCVVLVYHNMHIGFLASRKSNSFTNFRLSVGSASPPNNFLASTRPLKLSKPPKKPLFKEISIY